MVFNNGFHLIDQDFLLEAYRLTRKTSAPGIDQVTATQYAEHVEDNLRDLHERLRDDRYVAPPVERVWIEKEGGKKRPIGKPICPAYCITFLNGLRIARAAPTVRQAQDACTEYNG